MDDKTHLEHSLSVEKTDGVARTPLGEKLLMLRAKAVASGMKLLSEEEVLDELKRRRGGG